MGLVWPFIQGHDDLTDPQLVADTIAKECEKYSLDQRYFSPFARNAAKYQYEFNGGKSDDITVAVAQIKLASKKTA